MIEAYDQHVIDWYLRKRTLQGNLAELRESVFTIIQEILNLIHK